MTEASEKIRRVGYICVECKQTRSLNIDADVHLKRRELSINGPASYIDVHADKEGNRHGVKLFIDPNFHVRTNNVLKIKREVKLPTGPGPSIPMPGMKTKNLTTKFAWSSWSRLELNLKAEGITFVLEVENKNSSSKIPSVSTSSELGAVTCSADPVVEEDSDEVIEYMDGWLTSLCNSLELASSLHMDLIPEILRYIDHHVHRRITYNDEVIINILVDKAAILIPDKTTMQMVSKYGPAMKLIGLDPVSLGKIATRLSKEDQFSMVDIQKILENEMDKESALEEEVIVLAMFYLISLDAFDYKLSYLQEN